MPQVEKRRRDAGRRKAGFGIDAACLRVASMGRGSGRNSAIRTPASSCPPRDRRAAPRTGSRDAVAACVGESRPGSDLDGSGSPGPAARPPAETAAASRRQVGPRVVERFEGGRGPGTRWRRLLRDRRRGGAAIRVPRPPAAGACFGRGRPASAAGPIRFAARWPPDQTGAEGGERCRQGPGR